MRMTIGKKLSICFIFIIAAMVVMGISSYVSLSRIKSSTDSVAQNSQKMREISRLRFPLIETLIINDYVVSGDVQKKEHFDHLCRVVEDIMRDRDNMLFSDEENALLNKTEEFFEVIREKSDEIIKFSDLSKKDFIDPGSNKIVEEIDTVAAIVIDNLEGLSELVRRDLEEEISRSERIKSAGIKTIVTASIITVVIGIAGWFILARIITVPLRSLITTTKIMAGGDLNPETEIKSSDEIGELAKSFNEMAEDLRKATVSRNYVDNIISNMDNSLIVTDPEGKIRTINPVTADLLGYQIDELIGSQVSEVLAQGELLFQKNGLGDLMKNGFLSKVEENYLAKDGRKIPVLCSATVMRDGKGKIQGIVYVALDITERKLFEDEIRKMSRAVEQSASTIIITDNNGNIEYANPRFFQLTGYSLEEVVGKNPRILKSGRTTSEEYECLWNTIISGSEWHGEFCNRKKGGELYWESASISPIKNSEGVITNFIAVKEDISERKQAEEKLIAYQAQLKSLASELSLTEERERRNIATELHDGICQMLAVTKLKLEMFQDSEFTIETKSRLNDICDLLDKVYKQARSLTYELSPPVLYEFGFEPALEWLVKQYEDQYDIRIEIINDGRPKPLDNVMNVFLFKTVRELLINVVKHGKAQNAKVVIEEDENGIRIGVEDDGIGFDTLESRFPASKSGGFGLFNIQERLAQIGGSFEIKSEPGHGTRASLIVPKKLKTETIQEKQA